jgi:hypothetical protein
MKAFAILVVAFIVLLVWIADAIGKELDAWRRH